MKHNLKRVLHLTQARDFTVRAIRAWRNLLPDWKPSLDQLRELDTRPHEHVAAVRIVADGWGHEDARWDVLLALLEWERRMAVEKEGTRQLFEDFRERMAEASEESREIVVPLKVVKGTTVLSESETTIETPLKALFLDRLAPVRHLSVRDSNE